jgi:hypothetical protein
MEQRRWFSFNKILSHLSFQKYCLEDVGTRGKTRNNDKLELNEDALTSGTFFFFFFFEMDQAIFHPQLPE